MIWIMFFHNRLFLQNIVSFKDIFQLLIPKIPAFIVFFKVFFCFQFGFFFKFSYFRPAVLKVWYKDP